MDPSQRLTCDELLNHAYLDRYDLFDNKKSNRSNQRERVRYSSLLSPCLITDSPSPPRASCNECLCIIYRTTLFPTLTILPSPSHQYSIQNSHRIKIHSRTRYVQQMSSYISHVGLSLNYSVSHRVPQLISPTYDGLLMNSCPWMFWRLK